MVPRCRNIGARGLRFGIQPAYPSLPAFQGYRRELHVCLQKAFMTDRPHALLFDLDGTLIDSAPDLAGSANDMRVARGMAPLPHARFRPMVGAGARGMIGVAMGITPDDAAFERLRDEFLDIYARRLLSQTRVFD